MSEWRAMTLQDAGVALIDCVHATPKAVEAGYPYIAIPQMKNGRIDFNDARKISRTDYIEWTKKARPQIHDVVLSRRTNPGVTATFGDRCDFALGQNLVLLRADGRHVLPEFLRWLVGGPAWWGQIEKFNNVGAIFDSLRCADVPRFELPIPPKTDQRNIASLLSALDDKIELNRRMNATLEAMARAIFADASTEWPLTKVSELAEIFDGPHATPPKTSSGPLFLGISSLASGQLDLTSTEHVDEEHFVRWTRRITPSAGDVVFSYETRLGQCARIPLNMRCCLGRRMGLLRPNPARVYSSLLLEAYLSPEFQDTIRSRTIHGSTVDRLPLIEMGNFQIRMTDIGEQRRIVGIIASLRNRMDLNADENISLASIRNLLLPKLMSREIRVKDAEKMVGEAA